MERHTNAALMKEVVRSAEGMVTIGLKAATSPSIRETGGQREAVTAPQARTAYQAVVDLGIEPQRLLAHFGAIHARISASDVPLLLASPYVNYISPHRTYRLLDDHRGTTDTAAHASSAAPLAQTIPWGVTMIRAPAAWSHSSGNGAKVMIIDVGHDQGHFDLPAVPSGNCGGAFDGCEDNIGHGTHVLGDLVGRHNSFGSVGVARGVAASDVYVWAACDGSEETCDQAQIEAGVEQGITWDVDVINMSFGDDSSSVGVQDALWSAYWADIALVAGAGNAGNTEEVWPAASTRVWGVSGIDQNKNLATNEPVPPCQAGGARSSSYGSPNTSFTAPFITYNAEAGGGYANRCGTSFSAPHLSGVIALIRAVDPTLSYQDLLTRLQESADQTSWDEEFGWGLVDAYDAVGPWPQISGPSLVNENESCEWQGSASGGVTPYSYRWYKDQSLVGTSQDLLLCSTGTSSFSLKLEVTDDQSFAFSETIWVTVDEGDESDCLN